MPIIKYITATAIVTVLYRPPARAFLSFGTHRACAPVRGVAWAEEEPSGDLEIPISKPTTTENLLQERKELPTTCDEPTEPEPLEIPAEEEKPPPPKMPDVRQELKSTGIHRVVTGNCRKF
jgi:hypothetical protein